MFLKSIFNQLLQTSLDTPAHINTEYNTKK